MGKLRDESVSSLDFAEFAATVLQAIRVSDFPRAVALVRGDEPSFTQVKALAASNDLPDLLLAYGPTFAACFIGGAENLSLAGNFWHGYFNDLSGLTGTVSENRFTVSTAQYVANVLAAGGLLPGAQAVYVGHSFGGTVAQQLALWRQQTGGTARGYHCSFGSPKWAKADTSTAVGAVPGARWFNDDDPIPLFPFTVRDSLTTVLLIPPIMQNQLSTFVQPRGGVQLLANGNHAPETLPTNANVGNILTYPGYLLGITEQPLGPHAISEYVSRLQTAVEHTRQPLNSVRLSVQEERPQHSSRLFVNREEERVATALSVATETQHQATLDVPRVQLFTYSRQGRVFVIAFGNVPVGLTSQRREARILTRKFNSALRHMQTLGYVSPDNFLKQMEGYITAASTPGGGFTPVMNTTLPQ
jgi:hypothetical protein